MPRAALSGKKKPGLPVGGQHGSAGASGLGNLSPKQHHGTRSGPSRGHGLLSLLPPYLCFEGNLLALFSSSSRRLRASSSWVSGLGAGLGGMVGS